VAVMTGFFDTSVLLAGLIEFGPMSVEAQRVIAGIAARRARRPHTAWHCCLEFYAVSTRLPEELRLTPSDALRLIEEEILARFRVHQLPERVQPEFLRGVGEEGLVGGRIYDAHIAEIARIAGVRVVVTENRRHFAPLLRHGIRVLSAREFAEEVGL
jgi:predicted nucleic acid-binding protein